MHLTIQKKMFLCLMVVVLIFVGLVNFIIYYLLNDVTHREVIAGLENSVSAYHRFDDQRKDLMITQARSMAQTAHLKATLTIPDVDTETVYFSGVELKHIAAPELLLILNQNGYLLADINHKCAIQEDLIAQPGVKTALTGENYYGAWQYGQWFYRVAIVPSLVNQQVVGLIAVGQRLDRSEVIKLDEEVAGINSIVSLSDQVYSADTNINQKDEHNLIDRQALVSAAQAGTTIGEIEGSLLSTAEVNGKLYYTTNISHPDIDGSTLFYRSINHLSASLDPVRLILFLGSLLTVLIGLLLSLRVSSAVSRPIVKLTQAAEQYGKGKFDIKVVSESNDEVGALTDAFNHMANDIAIQRQALVASKDKAEAASRAKSTFLATMSHEIRTPLNGILGMADLLRNTRLASRQNRFVSIINESGNNLLDIINDILDFSKIEAGKLELNNSDFSLRKFIEDISHLFATSVQNKGLEFVCNIPPNASLLVKGDEIRLRQILANLISNAVKFTEEGYIEVKVSVLEKTNTKARVMFEVNDTGVGINSEKLDAIFQSFIQADGSTTRKFGGTGLGLAIAKQLVELMGGTIEVNSEVGMGTCFHFEIPLDAMALPNEGRQPSLLNLKGRTALIVDDVLTNREILEQQLDAWGIHSKQVASGQEALDILHQAEIDQCPFDMALLDYNMPHMNGITLAQAIKKEKCFRQLPLALLSCVQDPEIEKKAKLSGIRFCLSKPVRQSELYDALVSMIADYSTEDTKYLIDNDNFNPVETIPDINAHILIVEDTLVNQEVAATMLDSYGCSYMIASDGVEALEIVKKSNFDLILMDCQMPNMDGFEATVKLRNIEKTLGQASTPIIALTANAIEGDRERCITAGMDDYITKPFNQKTLNEVLLKWLSHNSIDKVTRTTEASIQHKLDDVAKPFTLSQTTYTELPDDLERIQKTVILDPSVLVQFKQFQKPGREDVIERLKQAFAKDAPLHIKNILNAAESNEADALYKAAHALKSSSANLGAKRLSLLCLSIEKIGRTGTIETTEPLIALLHPIYESTICVLSAEQTEAAV